MSQLWWIEKNGKLLKYGRYLQIVAVGKNWIYEVGAPVLFYSKKEAVKHCKEGEKPVKVRIVREGEK